MVARGWPKGKPRGPAKPGTRKALDAGRNKRNAETKDREPVGPNRHNLLLTGELKVWQLDDEELLRRQGRDQYGEFVYTSRTKLPLSLIDEMKRELIDRMQRKIDQGMPGAVDAINDIVENPDEKAADRLRAAGMVLDRGMGKVPETVTITPGSTWTQLSGEEVESQRDFIDGEVVDELQLSELEEE